ncbi:OmpP1/FadL family transporter [Sulfurirhabdus autotrophica]|uniref:Long-chain fatty acid transport protein n=1 Tax=Sulfurirhabdus autotrophica TaxID=1706046 RepID=A0A4R3Y079_9PROT|nr:outer membrane protein transport protein [Sulfurirhabdus autotrophica]TCV83393.1 long-chain fatty acid transport protein [Sulfurirhabdus autotrophica]
MRIKSKRLLTVAAIAGLLIAPINALATNGYFMIGFGAGSTGMGGIGVTSPQDSMCVGGNPACLGEFISPQFDMGAGIIKAERYSGTNIMGAGDVAKFGPNGVTVWSDVNTYLLPGMGFVFPFTEQLSIGIAALGNGGAGTNYKTNFFSGTNDRLGVDLVQLIVPITAAYKLDATHTIGASIVPASQRFRANGLHSFDAFSSDKEHLTDNGHDYVNGLGVRFGWTGHFFDNKLTLGATYASKVYMAKFEKYKGLFAEQGTFDIPENYAVGIAIKPIENLTVALDVQQILYSGVSSVGNRGPTPTVLGVTSCDQTQPVTANNCGGTSLGADNGAGFGWKDQTVYKLGVAYNNAFPSLVGANKLTLRAGVNYGKTPIQQDQLLFSLLAPAASEWHYTAGFTYSLGDQSIMGFGSEGLISGAWTHAPMVRMSGPVIGTSGEFGIAQFGMRMNIFELAYTLKF